MAEDWQRHGQEMFKRVRRESPAAYLKVCGMLVPWEMKVEHSNAIKDLQADTASTLRGLARAARCAPLAILAIT